MCGFAGEYILTGRAERADLDLARRMASMLAHRGPDEDGAALSIDERCAMGFRRLSVIDPAGSHQPFVSPDEKVTLAFNGEIYNFRELRALLEADGVAFTTAGDTEVLMAMYLHYGLSMLDRLQGMFGVAIHDVRTGSLHLLRDRLGVKPLWWAQTADRVLFASEAKALLVHPGLDASIDESALGWYLTLGYVPAPRTIWRGIRKLTPGSVLSFADGRAESARWWTPPRAPQQALLSNAVERLREKVTAAVERRLVADVPLGALLSGGVDSSIVAAVMAEKVGHAGGVKTFSVGFADEQFDERPFARRVSEHIGSEHRELTVEVDAVDLIDTLVAQYDEPFADSSALPTYLLCRAVREHVTVALCGDGGDEAFAGYDRHRAMWLAQHMPTWKAALVSFGGALADTFAPRNERAPLRRFARFAAGLDAPPALRYLGYRQLFTPAQISDLLTDDLADRLVLTEPRDGFVELYESAECDSELMASQRCDVMTYLPDDLLVKADIASMAHGLELRSPMLDPIVMELGLTLPDELKVDRHGGKRILAQAFGHLLPAEVFRRPKMGFGVPIHDWLRGPLLPMLRETLLDQAFIDVGWLKRTAMETLIDEHVEAKADHRHRLWALLWLGRWAKHCGL